MDETKENPIMLKIEKEMSLQYRGWFESLAFWPKYQTLMFVAKQIAVEEMWGGNATIARVEILDGNIVLFSDEIYWPLKVGEENLVMQVYFLSQVPDYKGPKKWQKLMEQFCHCFDYFKAPTDLRWVKKPLID